MEAGSYSLVRCIPDPVRGEIFNIGIIAWGDDRFHLKIDQDAARKATGQSRYVSKDTWTYFDTFLREKLVRGNEFDLSLIESWVRNPPGEILRISKPAYFAFPEGEHGFDERFSEIMKRLVMPVNRGGGPGDPSRVIKGRLKPFIERDLVYENFPFPETRSTILRSCEFFVNSGANVALDTLRLDIKDTNTVYERIDAEASKISDIRAENDLRFFVYCQPGHSEGADEIEDRARKILSAVDAEVILNLDEASEFLRTEAERQLHRQSAYSVR